MTGCPPDGWLELAQATLPAPEARRLTQHAESCVPCADKLLAARDMNAEIVALRERTDAATRERIWQSMALRAEATRETRTARKAWHTLLKRPSSWAWAASLAAVLAVAFAWVWRSRPAADAPKAVVVAVEVPALRPTPSPPALPITAELQAVAQMPAAARGTTVPPAEVAAIPPEPHAAKAPQGRVHLACGGVVDTISARLTYLRDLPHAAELRLDQGTVAVHVPHLPPGSTLEVRTEDAIVRVKGTRFTVTKTDADATTVQVQEGTVWVAPHGGQRELVVLHAGDRTRIEGERAYLHGLLRALDDAIGSGDLAEAQRRAQRYLEAAGDGSDAAEVRVRLAGIYVAQDRPDDAARMYRLVTEGSAPRTVRDNAFAMLASLYRDLHKPTLEQAIWSSYLDRFPRGLHEREALLRQIELACGRRDATLGPIRTMLVERFGGEPLVRDVISRCTPAAVP